MKLTALFLTAGNFVSAKSERGLMWLGERYIYDDPLCEDISMCRGEKGNGFETWKLKKNFPQFFDKDVVI